MSDAYARQGMKPVQTALGGLFASSGSGGGDDDSLAYQRVSAAGGARKQAGSTLPAPAAGGGSSSSSGGGGAGSISSRPEFIFATAVSGLFFLKPGGGGYEARGAGASIGCVVVGAGAVYNLMFYDAAKTTLLVTPVTQMVRF